MLPHMLQYILTTQPASHSTHTAITPALFLFQRTNYSWSWLKPVSPSVQWIPSSQELLFRMPPPASASLFFFSLCSSIPTSMQTCRYVSVIHWKKSSTHIFLQLLPALLCFLFNEMIICAFSICSSPFPPETTLIRFLSQPSKQSCSYQGYSDIRIARCSGEFSVFISPSLSGAFDSPSVPSHNTVFTILDNTPSWNPLPTLMTPLSQSSVLTPLHLPSLQAILCWRVSSLCFLHFCSIIPVKWLYISSVCLRFANVNT